MLKLISLFSLLFLFFQTPAQGALKESMRPESITVFVAENMPYSGFNARRDVQGLFADFWHAWSQDTGIPVKFEPYHKQDIVKLVTENKAAVYSGIGDEISLLENLPKSTLMAITSQFYYFPSRSAQISPALAEKNHPAIVGGVLPNADQLPLFRNTPNLIYKEYPGLFEILIDLFSGDIDTFVLFTANPNSQTWLDKLLLLVFNKTELQPSTNSLFAYTSAQQQNFLDWIEWGKQLDPMADKITSAVAKANHPLWGASSEMVRNLLIFFCIGTFFMVYSRNRRIQDDQFDDVADSSPYPLVVFSLDGEKIVYANDEIKRLFPFKKNKKNYLFKEPENQLLLSRLINNASHQTKIENSQIRLMADDDYLDIEVSTKRIHYKRQTAWLCHLKDVTELLEVQRQLDEQREFLRAVLAAMPEQVMFKSPQGRIITCNKSWATAHKTDIKDATGRSAEAFVPSTDNQKEASVWEGETYQAQEWIEHDNKLCLFNSCQIPLYDKQQHVFAMLTIDHDITELHKLNKQIFSEKSQRLDIDKELIQQGLILKVLLDKGIDPTGLIDEEGRIIAANKHFAKLFAVDPESIVGMSLNELHSSDQTDWAERYNQDIIDSGSAVSFEEVIFCDGKHTSYEVHKEQDNESRFVIIIAQDISARKQAEKLMHQAAENSNQQVLVDKLTNIANRYAFDIQLNQQWSVAGKEQELLSLLMCDIDFFDTYNNNYGQYRGDQALQTIAATLETKSEALGCFVARYGGSKFVLLIKGGNATKALKIAEEIHLDVAELKLEHDYSPGNGFLSVSIGLSSLFPSELTTPKMLIAEVEAGLYDAQMAGRDQVGIH
ncbi:diguanylate cyclase domain-containing protein [Psychromonas sp.]|uniref:diguanylate cyclase domain-containing protein n=1 Tax=Psychromonas sp. TaxID=1884585 RepID=UPI00356568E4